MLEPAVRPVGTGAAGSRAPTAPIESVSFESLLERARALNAAEAGSNDAPSDRAETPAATPGPPELLGQLRRLDRVANASLLALMAGNEPRVGVK